MTDLSCQLIGSFGLWVPPMEMKLRDAVDRRFRK